MNRRLERRLTLLMGIWQILDGVFTILYFGIYRSSSLILTNRDMLHTPINSEFLLISTFGTMLVVLGIINLLLAKKYMRDDTLNRKIGFYLLGQSLLSYFIFDILSLVLGMSAAVIYLAKNKSITLLTRKGR